MDKPALTEFRKGGREVSIMEIGKTIENILSIESSRRGEIIASDASAIPEGLRPYMESEMVKGNNVYVDMHGNVIVREAYEIPKVPELRPSSPKTGDMIEGAIIDVR
jgi:hypothetical protein